MDEKKEKFDELDTLEKTAENLLEELTQLENLPDSSLTQKSYLNSIKNVQDQMKEAILQGIQLNDRKKFSKGLEFYEKNYVILTLIGDRRVCEDYQHEMIQILTDLIVHFKNEINNPLRRFFIILSLQFIAKIYEDAQNFSRAIEIRLTISNLLNSWASALEYAAIVLDYLLNKELTKAMEFIMQFDLLESKIYLLNSDIVEQSVESRRLINLKEFCEAIITGVTKDLPVFFEDAKELLETINLPENFDFERVSFLFNLYKTKMLEPLHRVETQIPVESPSNLPPETQLLVDIKNVFLESMGSYQIPENKTLSTANIDTSKIVTELKQFITNSIKTLGQEIISNVSKFTHVVPHTQRGKPSSEFDDNIPEIKILSEIDPNDKPKRPKLSDVLDSIVISE